MRLQQQMDAQTVQLEPIHFLVVSKLHAQLKTVHLDSTLLNLRQQRLTMGVPIVDSANILVPDKKLHALTRFARQEHNHQKKMRLQQQMDAQTVQLEPIHFLVVSKLHAQLKTVHLDSTLLNLRQQRLTMGVPIVDSANILVPDKKLHALTKLVQPDSNLRRTTQLIIRMVARIVVKDINPEQVLKLVVQFKYVIRVNTLL